MDQTFLPVADSLRLVRLRPREGLHVSLVYQPVAASNTFEMGTVSSAYKVLKRKRMLKPTVVSC